MKHLWFFKDTVTKINASRDALGGKTQKLKAREITKINAIMAADLERIRAAGHGDSVYNVRLAPLLETDQPLGLRGPWRIVGIPYEGNALRTGLRFPWAHRIELGIVVGLRGDETTAQLIRLCTQFQLAFSPDGDHIYYERICIGNDGGGSYEGEPVYPDDNVIALGLGS